MARIVIGIPCFGDVPVEVYEDHTRLLYYLGRRYPEHEFFLGIKKKSEQFRARNAIIRSAFSVKADYVLMIDDDMIFEYNDAINAGCTQIDAYEFLHKMIEHDVDLLGILYVTRGGLYEPVALMEHGPSYRKVEWSEITYDGLMPVDSIGGGVMLMKVDMLRKMEMPIFDAEYQWGTDIQLCRKAKALGIQPYIDANIQVGHLSRDRAIVTPKNYGEYITDKILSRSKEFSPVVRETLTEKMLEKFTPL